MLGEPRANTREKKTSEPSRKKDGKVKRRDGWTEVGPFSRKLSWWMLHQDSKKTLTTPVFISPFIYFFYVINTTRMTDSSLGLASVFTLAIVLFPREKTVANTDSRPIDNSSVIHWKLKKRGRRKKGHHVAIDGKTVTTQ